MSNLIRNAFCKVVRETRDKQGLSGEKLAKMLGMSYQMYTQLENGLYTPSLQVLFDLYEILGFELKDIKDKVNQLAKVK
jgi:transcriptional regulator with XRE-family HTH domain